MRWTRGQHTSHVVVVLRGSFDLLKGGVTVKEKEGIVVGMTFSNFPLCRVGQLERDMAHHGFSREKAMSE
jgi:hypothetical protein